MVLETLDEIESCRRRERAAELPELRGDEETGTALRLEGEPCGPVRLVKSGGAAREPCGGELLLVPLVDDPAEVRRERGVVCREGGESCQGQRLHGQSSLARLQISPDARSGTFVRPRRRPRVEVGRATR